MSSKTESLGQRAERFLRGLFPPEGQFTCLNCGGMFPNDQRGTRDVLITQALADLLQEPEAIGQTDILEYCPNCFNETKKFFPNNS